MNPNETTPLRVLVVDDDPGTLRLMAKLVESAGYCVSQAKDGHEALDSFARELPDIVVCDWDMPGLDGLALCRRIREHYVSRYLYVLILTAKSSTDEMVEGLTAGADDFVAKPVNRAVLLARLEAGERVLRMERQLREASERDPLTGTLNRRTFHLRLAKEWERATRYSHPLSCVLIDLDFFKRINDTYGHAVGDETLKAVATHLQRQIRPSDALCRYGGEEFCVFLAETSEEGAASWAERCRLAISSTPITAGDLSLHVTASLGVAERLFVSGNGNPEQLVALADQALAMAKQSGRDRVIRFGKLSEEVPDICDGDTSAGPLNGVYARDVMSVALARPSQFDTVHHVANLFLQLRLDSAPVVDEEGKVIGIVADTDLLTHTSLGNGWEDKIHDVMRTDVVCYEEDTPLRQVFEFLARVPVPRVVVVSEGRPTGMISRATLLRWLRNWGTVRDTIDIDGQWTWADVERERRRAGIIKISEAVEERAVQMRRGISKNGVDLIPCVVGEATRLQSLVNDLLGHCRSHHVS